MPVTWSERRRGEEIGWERDWFTVWCSCTIIASDHTLPKKNVKRLFKKRRWNMRNYSFTLFPCFCFRLLWLWFVFLDSVSVLRFNFVFFWVCFLLGMLISVLGFVFLFSGSVFLFWVSVLSMCFCFGFVLSYFCCCCCCLVVFLFLSATLYIW